MTRKDYQAIAAVIAATVRDTALGSDGRKAASNLAVGLCAILRADNPRFDSGKFLAACGL